MFKYRTVRAVPLPSQYHWADAGLLINWYCGVWSMPKFCSGDSSGYQKGFRWLHASGTTIGSYTKCNGTFVALRPVYPGGSNVLERVTFTCFRWHKANGELETSGVSM